MRPSTTDLHGHPSELTLGVQWLLTLNIVTFAVEAFTGLRLRDGLALQADWWRGLNVWQLLSYQFVHQSFNHLFSNMLGLYFLGPETERALGTSRFCTLYLLSGVLGGAGWSMLSPDYHSCVGASGAVFGILGAYAALYPRRELILIFFPFMPLRAWLFILLLGTYELIHTLQGPGGRVANAAHLGGGLAGYLYATILSRPHLLQKLRQVCTARPHPTDSRAEIDRILDKAAQHGLHSLTHSERERLRRASK
jgi:membrane associated rhomboid family serine protease